MNIRLALIVAVTLSVGAQASSHREAPFITKYPQVDATDFYTFMSYQPGREDYVTLIATTCRYKRPTAVPTISPSTAKRCMRFTWTTTEMPTKT